MTTEQYSIGYEDGYQDGWNESQDAQNPQRTWVGLTEKEVNKIIGSDRYSELLKAVVQTVEAKLKEKNGLQ